MSKQTALQWLEQEFVKLESTVGVYGVMYELIEQAKQMEKEQIETAWHDGIMGGQCGDSKQYYNETYGGNNEQH
jgi:hypothetical protein